VHCKYSSHEANFYEAEARCHEAEIEAEARKSEAEAEASRPMGPAFCDFLSSQSLGFVLRKKNPTQQKQTFSGKKTKNAKINLKLGVIASYDVRPRNGGILFL